MYTDPDQAPRSFGEAPTSATHQHGKSHHWIHLLMCASMLLVITGYLWAGRTSLAADGVLAVLVPAISCILMMWLMMHIMNHGSQHWPPPAIYRQHRLEE